MVRWEGGDEREFPRALRGSGGLDARVRRALAPAYRVMGRTGSKGFWTTYVAGDRGAEDRVVLLSVLPVAEWAGGKDVAEAIMTRLASAGQFPHPGLVRHFAHGAEDGLFWFVTRRDLGQSLSELLRERGLSTEGELRRMARQIASALALLHRRGLVHGGICTDNVMIDRRGVTRFANVGLDAPVLLHRVARREDPGPVGAAAAPEVLSGEEPTPLSDQFSFARILAEARGSRDDGVADVLALGTSEDPTARFQDVTAFLDAFLEASAPAAASPAGAADRAGRAMPPAVLVPDREPEATGRPRRLTGSRGMFAVLAFGALAAGAVVGEKALAGNELTVTLAGGRDRAAAVRPSTASATAAPGFRASPEPDGGAPETVAGPPSALPTDATREPVATLRKEPPSAFEVNRAPPPARTTDGSGATSSAAVAAPVADTRPGRLYLNAFPWGTVYLNGDPIGNTPLVGIPVAPGTHVVRVEREGFEPFEERIRVGAGGELRRTDIVLRKNQGS